MIAIRGAGSTIVQQLLPLLPEGEESKAISRFADMPTDCERYLFCAGVLRAKKAQDQSPDEMTEGFHVNLWQVVTDCERILAGNAKARICIIGSESGFSGSFDGVYAVAKGEIHRYVEKTRLKSPHQQLICIAPSIISDTGMTSRRDDKSNLLERRALHPKQRFLKALEVARLVHYVLYVDLGYLSGTVIRMNGGGR